MKYRQAAYLIISLGLISALACSTADAQQNAPRENGSRPQIDGKDISKNFLSPLVDTSSYNKRHLGKISHLATSEGGKTLLNEFAYFASILKPLSESLAAWQGRDPVGFGEAWLDFKASGALSSVTGAVGFAAGGPAGGFVGAFLGGVLYNLTGDQLTDEAGDKLADWKSDRTDADRRADRKRVERKKKQREARDRQYRFRCEDYQRDFEKDPRSVIGVVAPDMKRCLELGVDVLRSRNCSSDQRWHKFLKKCATRHEFDRYCKGKYPGSIRDLKAPTLCKCPKGTGWNQQAGRCAPSGTGKKQVREFGPLTCPSMGNKDIHIKKGRVSYSCGYWKNNGRLRSEQPYVNNTAHGVSTHFRNDGNLKVRIKWRNGDSVKRWEYNKYGKPVH